MKDDMTCAKRELLNNSNKTRELANNVLSTQTEVEKVKRTLQPLIVESHLEQERLSIDAAISEAKVSLGVEFSSMCDTYLETADLLESKLENMQRDLKGFRNTAHAALLESKTNFEDIAALKSELGHLRQDLALERSSKSSSTNTAFTSHEVDIITSNITKIGNKASQIEPLQMELELLKSRMQRIEAQAAGWQREPPASTGGKQLQQNLLPDPDWGYSRGASIKGSVGSNGPAIPKTRDNHINPSTPPTVYHSPPDLSSSPIAFEKRRKSSGPRITKAGTVDKRCLRDRSKPATTVRISRTPGKS
ncbi:hypothetical protein F5Y08DRAFT_151179 [Xylaria arbuscula]|nr:hypothetical protein F5Y08DRAFT_151179 [Xylaria arbuscula]